MKIIQCRNWWIFFCHCARKRICSGRTGLAILVRYDGRVLDKQAGALLQWTFCQNFQRKASKGKYFWVCSTFQKQGKAYCPSKQIPELTLIKTAAEVLCMDGFDENLFAQLITEIRVPEANRIEFVFKDGHVVGKNWRDCSWAESWTDEMREAARQKNIARRNAKWHKQKQ